VKRGIVLLIVLFSSLVVSCASWAQKDASAPVTIIKAGFLIDGASATVRRNVIITIRGNKIGDVADGGVTIPTNLPAGAAFIDLSQATVLPGLIDAHTHIFLQGEDPAEGGYDIQLLKYPLAFRAARATVSVRRALEQGFTTLRDMETEGAGYGDVGIKMAIEGGYKRGPGIYPPSIAILIPTSP